MYELKLVMKILLTEEKQYIYNKLDERSPRLSGKRWIG